MQQHRGTLKRYTNGKKATQKVTYCRIPFTWNVQNCQIYRDGEQISGCWGLTRRGNGGWQLKAYRVSFRGGKNVLNRFGVGFTALKILEIIQPHHLKGWILWHGNYISIKRFQYLTVWISLLITWGTANTYWMLPISWCKCRQMFLWRARASVFQALPTVQALYSLTCALVVGE